MTNLHEAIRQTLPTVARQLGVLLEPAAEPFVEQQLNGFFFDNALRFLNKYFRQAPRPLPLGGSM